MNVRVRFCAVAALTAFTLGAVPLAAQPAAPAVREASPTLAAIGVQPNAIIDSVTALASSTGSSSAPSTVVATSRGPSIANARVASHRVSAPHGAPPVLQNRTSNRNAVALMIVGGAALVIGAVIGDDAGTLVMLGGAGIGLYGLYQFLT
jgi:hypothetical protein